jgi:lipoyl(octanoyl) transferase
MERILVEDLGLIEYKNAWDIQERYMAEHLEQKKSKGQSNLPHRLLFAEHPHVYTLGKSGDESHLLANPTFLKQINATYFKTNRGGDITYHGPGQMVVYPILDLERVYMDIGRYMRDLEEAVIKTIGHWQIKGDRLAGATGVWLDPATNPRKICAMGVKASRWVTIHGLALNVNTDLNYFNYIVPCGISDKGVTSMAKELNSPLDMGSVKKIFKDAFCEVMAFSY